MNRLDEIKQLLDQTLQLGPRAATLTAQSPLLGALPELDSMAVVTVLTSLEEHYGFIVADDELSAETFATLGNLHQFVEQKLQAG